MSKEDLQKNQTPDEPSSSINENCNGVKPSEAKPKGGVPRSLLFAAFISVIAGGGYNINHDDIE